MSMIPQGREVGVHATGERQSQVLPIPVVGRGYDGGTRRLDEIVERLGKDARRIEMLNNFQTDDDREASIGFSKVIVGRSGLERQVWIAASSLFQPLG